MLVDVDTKDERVLEDALSTYGDTPIVSRTATGGGFHAWYRYSDEAWKNHSDARRAIRPDPTKPFDFLAGGMAVAPTVRRPEKAIRHCSNGPSDRYPQRVSRIRHLFSTNSSALFVPPCY
jgi:hypothetical protein